MKLFVIIVAVLLVFAGMASAATFSPANCLKVSIDGKGLVTVSGSPADVDKIKKLVQFCPDKYKGGCADNKFIPPASTSSGVKTFQMNTDSISIGQRAFNFKSGALWLQIPNPLVEVGSGLILEMSQSSPDSEDGKGGAHFVISANYQPLYPLRAGGEACVPTVSLEKPAVKKPVVEKVAPLAEQSMGGGDSSKATVKGDNNDVTPQTVKQQAKQKTVIKGNNNTVKKSINQIGAIKTTGKNSPVIIHLDGVPRASDKPCIECHKDVVKKDDAANGNVIEQQKNQEEVKKSEPPKKADDRPPFMKWFKK